MKEYIGTDGIPVVEYELEDIPKLISGELSWVFGLVRTQSHKEGGGSTWFRFTPEAEKVWNESKEAQEKTYWAVVEARLNAVKRMFLDTLKKSPDPAGTIADRIRQAQWKLEPDKDPTAPSELGIDPRSHLKQAWLTLKRGHREYDLSAFKFHHHQLQADIEHRFLQWLRDFQQSNKPDMIAGQAFAFTADGKLIEKPTLQTIVEYFNEQGAEVQLCANVSNEEVVLSGQVLKDNTDLEADAREADPSELQALFDAKFTKARDSNRFKTPQAFAKAEVKRLRKAWADDADRFPLAEQWFEHLERIASETATGDPAQPERANTPPQGSEGGTGAEIGAKLTQRQAAYLLAYQNAGIQDPRSDPNRLADKRAKQLCRKCSPTTGGQLYERFDELRSKSDRQRAFNTALDRFSEKHNKRIVESLLTDIKTIIPLLEGEQRTEAQNDLKRWDTAFQNEMN